MNKLWLVCSGLFIASLVKAQNQNLSMGVSTGIGHSWTSNSDGNSRFHPTYSFGSKMVYSFDSRWGVSADLRYSSEGGTVGVDADNKVVGRAAYIRLPLQGIYFFGQLGDRVRPKISLGPSFGFLVGGKSKTYEDGRKIIELKTTDFTRTFDFGAHIAAGLNIRLAPGTWLNTDFSYYLGLLNIHKMGGDVKNRNVALNVGLTFPLATLRPDRLGGKR